MDDQQPSAPALPPGPPAAQPPAEPARVSIDDFLKIDMRVARVVAAERVVADLRFAQSQAVTQGGLFRLHHGDDSGETGKYRIEQSTNGGATWVQVTGWYDLSSDYQGSSMQVVRDNDGAGAVRYFVRFNAQGAADNTGYTYPIRLTVVTPSGTTRSIQVMRTGVVRLM